MNFIKDLFIGTLAIGWLILVNIFPIIIVVIILGIIF